MNNYQIGRWGEDKVADLVSKDFGCKILSRNYRIPRGEIDIIFLDDDELVFAEVKTRSKAQFVKPCEAVDYVKRMRIKNAARHFIVEHNLFESYVRFDVFEVYYSFDKVVQIKNAF